MSQEPNVFGTFQPENFSTLTNFDAFGADAFEVLVYSNLQLQRPGVWINQLVFKSCLKLHCLEKARKDYKKVNRRLF